MGFMVSPPDKLVWVNKALMVIGVIRFQWSSINMIFMGKGMKRKS